MAKIFTLDESFNASNEEDSSDVPYEVMILSEHAKKEIQATEIERIERRASGPIIIYNDHNTSPQRLIKNTRFETPEGLIYRIRDSIVVPGQTAGSGRETPGSIEVTVYADQPGEDYNIGLTDFSIPGFKGTPRFNGFYARSKSEMSGGFSGVVKTAGEEDIEIAKRELIENASEKLLASAHSQKPEGFILYDDAIFLQPDLSLEDLEQKDIDQKTVVVSQKVTLYGILFDEEILGRALAELLVTGLTLEEQIEVRNLDELEFSVLEKNKFNPALNTEFSFMLRGEPHVVWLFDDEALKEKLFGKPRTEIKTVLAEFPSITKAEVTIRPFWKRSFPERVQDIRIEERITQ